MTKIKIFTVLVLHSPGGRAATTNTAFHAGHGAGVISGKVPVDADVGSNGNRITAMKARYKTPTTGQEPIDPRKSAVVAGWMDANRHLTGEVQPQFRIIDDAAVATISECL